VFISTNSSASRISSALERILADSPYVLRLRLEPGMGIVCNNVLHARSAFRDAPQHRRLLYRARYYDRVPTYAVGSMFWLRRKKLPGSYSFFRASRRS
jgi:alpha-ketoglutarate-dependent taurine dioxygenase